MVTVAGVSGSRPCVSVCFVVHGVYSALLCIDVSLSNPFGATKLYESSKLNSRDQ